MKELTLLQYFLKGVNNREKDRARVRRSPRINQCRRESPNGLRARMIADAVAAWVSYGTVGAFVIKVLLFCVRRRSVQRCSPTPSIV